MRALRVAGHRAVLWVGPYRRRWPRVNTNTACSDAGVARRALHTIKAASSSPSTAAPPYAPTTKPIQEVLVLPSADSFAQSRIKNYAQRILATPAPAGTESTSSPADGDTACTSVVGVTPRLLTDAEKKAYTATIGLEQGWVTTFDLPVDVFVEDRLTRRHIPATGIASDAKTSVVAACMHAERCLDALRIPLFTSERRQHQRALQARAEGRTAAEVSDVPFELSQVALPAPVFLPPGTSPPTPQRLASYQPTRPTMDSHVTAKSMVSAAERGRESGMDGRCGPRQPGHLEHLRGKRRKPLKRWETYTSRYGADLFLQTTMHELAALQSTLFAHNSPGDEDGDGDGGPAAESVDITADEVAILQPELLPRADAATPVGSNGGPADARAHTTSAGHPVMLERKLHHRPATTNSWVKLDESEDGTFDLVDGDPGEWVMTPEVSGAWCLRDTGAVARINQYLQRATGYSFTDSVQLRFTDEDTLQFVEKTGHFNQLPKRWYTASLELGEIGVRAIGKGTTQAAAFDMCAMHAEGLLQWFGVPIYTNPHAQALYYDACLKWGRPMAAIPIDPSTVDPQTVKLPKPLKEWFRPRKTRFRKSEPNVVEKLLRLNRMVVHAYRKHLTEVDPFATDTYTELFSLVEPCVRSFMVAMKHPFESAFFTLVYSADSQYRSTIYLPLPERYGVRGGYGIGTTPPHSVKLCALNAVDVLCALDVIPSACMAQPRWQRMMELRVSLGMILPPSYLYARQLAKATTDAARAALGPPPPLPHTQLRSPPAYREVPGYSTTMPPLEDVWRVMLMDVDVFDVIPALTELNEESARLGLSDYAITVLQMFREATTYLFHWSSTEAEYPRHLFHFIGPQLHHHMIKVHANNFWMELPLDTAVYGRRVALGRCTTRRGAERAMCIHAFRILRTLKLAPWETLGVPELASELYGGNTLKAEKRKAQWKWLCTAVLDRSDDPLREQLNQSTPEAEITCEVLSSGAKGMAVEADGKNTAGSVNMVQVLSPHPVMSRELALVTFS